MNPEIIELTIDDEIELSGVQAVSIVENPAIEEDFIALKKVKPVQFATIDKEQQILVGPALIPNKPILRIKENDEGETEEYYAYFSRETIKKASQLFFIRNNQSEATLEHEHKLQDLTVVESWIIEDNKHDKSNKYNFNLPLGTWMIAMKVNDKAVWDEYVKTGKVKGFSIEGYFADAKQKPKENLASIEAAAAAELIEELKSVITNVSFQSYSDYPDAVKNNAKRGIALNEKANNKCATDVGKVRAQQLAKGKPISMTTIKRMYSYLSRAEEYYDASDTTACGTISFLLWGGKAAKRWAASKIKEK